MYRLILLLSLLALSVSLTPPQHPLASDSTISLSNNESLFSLHKSLVEITSISGHEHAVGEFLISYLQSQNYTVETQAVPSPFQTENNTIRHNILAYPGPHRQTKVLLTSHIDTVPPFINYSVRHSPSSGATEFWGRGTNDAKGCVAAQITALNELLSSSAISPRDASLLFVVGEETFGDGMRAANALNLSWDAVIFGEPTELKLANGHKGIMAFNVSATGRAAHSGYPWLGESAVEMLLPALAAILQLQLPSSERFGNSTINIGLLEGGEARNVVPAHARLQAAVRLGGGTPEIARWEIERAVRAVAPRLEVEFVKAGYPPVECDVDVKGFEVQTVNYGTDIPNLEGGHKRYLYGPGSILSAHSDHEMVRAVDLLEAVEGYKKLVLAALGKGE